MNRPSWSTSWSPRRGSSRSACRFSGVRRTGKVFPPYQLCLNLGPERYSPSLLRKIVFAGGGCESYEAAAQQLHKLAELNISSRHVERITERIGGELAAQRDEAVDRWFEDRKAPDRRELVPEVAAIGVDGGRIRTRAPDTPPGVHHPNWHETKVACLQTLDSPVHKEDPHPDVPKKFLEEKTVKRLVAQLSRSKGPKAVVKEPPSDAAAEPVSPSDNPRDEKPPSAEKPSWRPKVLERRCLASMATIYPFGKMLVTLAESLNLNRATRKAFLSDGDHKNWDLQQEHFFDWIPILDFIHLIEHLFQAAHVALPGLEGWGLYVQLVTAAWTGKTKDVLALLGDQAARLGAPPPNADNNDPRKIVAAAIGYVTNSLSRMDYPTYRKRGLPVSSCHVESLIKQYNFRVKASDKFWTEQSAENVLQVRSEILSQDDQWKNFWKNRAQFLASRTRAYHKQKAA